MERAAQILAELFAHSFKTCGHDSVECVRWYEALIAELKAEYEKKAA